MLKKAVLIVGGYGVVGKQVAKIYRERYPETPLILGGRSPENGESLAADLKPASTFLIDTNDPNLLNGLPKDLEAVVAVVNDPKNYLLKASLNNNIPYLDVTRWTEKFNDAVSYIDSIKPSSPAMLSSSWMGGLAPVIAMKCAQRLNKIEQIETDILYSLKDNAGPNSVEYMDRLSIPYPVTLNGQKKNTRPMSLSKRIDFSTGKKIRTYNFDTPEQATLPEITGAKTVITRIAFDDYWSTRSLAIIVKSGLWKAISGERFKDFRQSLLYHPGEGGEHRIKIKVSGLSDSGEPIAANALVIDPAGQTHLTAVSTVVQLERLLGLDGAAPPKAGFVLPETAPQYDWFLKALSQFGVITEFS